MKSELLQTHRKLTTLFTGIVFCLILVTGTVFLGAKYINSSRIAKQDFVRQSNEVTSRIQDIDNLERAAGVFERITGRPEFRNIRESTSKAASQISFFILDDSNTIIYKNLLENPDFDDILLEDIDRMSMKNSLLIWKTELERSDAKSIIFYKSLRYDMNDLRYDMLILLICTILLSWLVYTIGIKFVGRALRPVEENMKDMSDFIHNAGHELKTPLAVIRWNMQIMLAEENYDRELLKKSIWEVDRTNHLIEWLRELSEIWTISKKNHINLLDTIQEVVTSLKMYADEKWVSLRVTFSERFMIQANASELDIFLSNIIKNAILYNKKWGRVDISMQKNILTIEDTGIGMSPEELSKIFDRLYRAESARNMDGFGIGLSLVEKISQKNNWKISVSSVPKQGTKFEIVF